MKLVEIITELYNNDNGEIDGDNCNKGGNQEENGSFTQKLIEVFTRICTSIDPISITFMQIS